MAGKETGFVQLKKQIREHDIGTLYLFFGEETFIKDVYLAKMKTLVPDTGFGEFNYVILEGKEHSFGELDDIINSFPMMSEKKLVIFKNSGIFKSPNEDTKEFWIEKFKSMPDYILFIFDEKEVDKRCATYKAAVKYGMAVEFAYLKGVELVNWVQSTVLKAEKKIDKNDAEYFVSLCDEGLSAVKNELDKLISYCGKQIERSDIDRVVSKSLQVRIFEMTDGIMAKNTERVINILSELKTIKEPPFKILYSLSSTFDKLLYSKLLMAEGASYTEVAAKLGLPPFIAKKYTQSAGGFSQKFLIDRIKCIADIDLSIKQGETDDWTALETYVTECIYMK